MSNRHKVFDASRRNRKKEPITFDLVYERLTNPLAEGETPPEGYEEHWVDESARFICKGWLPALTLLELGDTWDTEMGVSLKGITRFFQTCLATRAEYDAFERVLADEDVQVEAEQLGELSQWLFEEYNGRPTGRSSASSPGPSRIGNGSTAPALSEGSTPSP